MERPHPAGAPSGWLRATCVLLVYVAAVFVAGALLAPWLHTAARLLAGPIPALEELVGYSFRRYVHRSILLFALIGLWPLARALGVRSWSDLGFRRGPGGAPGPRTSRAALS